MKVAVIGGTGLVGKAFGEVWHGDELVLAGSRQVDIRHPQQVDRFVAEHLPDWVVLAAAMTGVDACELDPGAADAINHRGAVHVAESCRAHGARLLFMSTDYVFDGTKSTPYEVDDPLCPVSVYGRSKAAAETALPSILPEVCIARTSWVFGDGPGFPRLILEKADKGDEIRALTDQLGCPNYSLYVAAVIARLAHASAKGIVHVTCSAPCTWYEFAQELLCVAERVGATVVPASMRELKRPAPRPSYSVLSDASLRKYAIELPSWRQALPEFVRRHRLRSNAHPVHAAG